MRRPMMTLLTTTCLALPVAQAAWAIDTPVAGSKLSVSDPVPVVTKRSLSFTLQDVAISLTGVDPTATGVSVAVSNANPGVVQSVTLSLPASSWTAVGTPVRSYRYKDRLLANGPVKSAQIKGGKLIKLSAKNMFGSLGFALSGLVQHRLDLVVTAGTSRWCGSFGGTVRKDDGAHFIAVNAPAPAVCAGGTTTTTTAASTTTTTTLAGSCGSSNFLNVTGAAGPGGSYSTLVPSVTASCNGTTMTVQSNGIPTYQYLALTPNGLQSKNYTFTFPRSPAVAATTTPVPLLGNMGVAVNGVPIYAVNEGPQPPSDAYGDPIAAAIMDQCGSHSAQQGTFHHHKLVVKCLLQSAVSSSQPWNNADPSPSQVSPVVGYAFDGFPIYGPYECTDGTCTSVQEMRSSWDNTGYQAGTVGCASSAVCSSGYCAAVMIGGVQTTACVPKTCTWSNNAYTAKAGSQFLDQCNGHIGPGGDYHYHATPTFPYTLGCYRGTPTNNGGNGTPPGGTCP